MGDGNSWCTCRPKFGPAGGYDTSGCPVHDRPDREEEPVSERVRSDADALAAIHQRLDGESWTPDTTLAIAEIVVSTGRTVRSPGDHERNDMYRAIKTMESLIDSGASDTRLIHQVEVIELLWLAMAVDNDDVPELPLADSPEDGPGVKRDARGRKFFASDWQSH